MSGTPAERAVRKHVPKSMKAWLREKAGVEKFIAAIPAKRDDEGDKWANAMIAYYRARLEHLEQNKPREHRKKKS